MKKGWDCISCVGIWLLLIGAAGALFFGIWYIQSLMDPNVTFSDGGVQNIAVISASAVTAIIGFYLTLSRSRAAKKWNRIVSIARSQDETSAEEAAIKADVTPEKAEEILYEAIGEGDLSGTIRNSTFYPTKGASSVSGESARVLVICPYCGAKTEQGLSKCQKCGADL